jgi:peptide/nickel transport system substrate-binding protein
MTEETSGGFDRFERFLEEWSRRDFLKTVSIGTAYAFFLAGGVAALEACGNPGTQEQTKGTPQKGGTLIEGWSTEPSYLLPVRSSDVYSNVANRLLFESLLTVDDKGNMQPNFAQKMPDVSSDGLTYTFKLRNDIKWSDGSALTPDDVVFTYELYYDPKYDGLLGNRRPTAKRYIKSATAQGDSIILQATTVFAPFLLNFGADVPIVPKKVLSGKTGVQLNTDDFNSAPPISNGKFKFQSWTKGDKLILARNDLYFRGRPNLDGWAYKKVPDAVAVLQQLKTGEIDVGRLDFSSYDEAKAQPNLNVLTFPTFGFDEYIYQLDPGKPGGQLFQDKSVRQALAYGLDRKAIVQAAYFGQAVLAASVIPSVSWAFNKDVKPNYTYDPKKAGDLLDAAGWKLGGTGIREKGGQKLSFDMVTNADNSTRVKNLEIMQEQWKKIGVETQIRNLANLGLLSDSLTSARQFALMFIGFSLQPYGEPDQSAIWHSRATAVGGNNGGLFKNTQVDKLLDDGVATLDRNKRKDIYLQLQNILADELPSNIICYPKGIYGVNKRVHDYNLGTFWLYGFGNPLFMKDVWVEPKK